MTLNQWAEMYKPMPNPFRVNTKYDFGQGDTMFYLVDLNILKSREEIPEENIWTILYNPNEEGFFELALGLVNKPAVGYFVCTHTPRFTPKEVILIA